MGVDGGPHAIDLAGKQVDDAGVADRVELRVSPLEDMTIDPPAALVVNNISMSESRDIDQVTRHVLDGLEPGGWFVISDFPFPETDEGAPTTSS